MTIQWFPGHMAKARRQVTEKLKLIDVVIELLDARLPVSSRNPMINEIIEKKPKLVLLNKADLADSDITAEWISYFQEHEDTKALAVDAQSGQGIKQIPGQCRALMQHMLQKRADKGMLPRSIRALIVGIPNVGKSSLINRLANKNMAKTGDRPGVTKAQQWIKVGSELELLDTPGILWPKFEDQQVGLKLAASGAIKDEILDFIEVALYTANYLKEYYPDRLQERYGLDELPEDKVEIIERIGEKRGCLMRGGIIDYEKACELLLREVRAGKLGQISFERPEV
ncbi:ribosome biogenesis GTPase YlqF [Bacillus horti]|uniref:Ribosome biogenesis GTPase A n=1 Tax=Caldalkalibacillus horti TaxID=77523 RepID=A0ABT9W288_9BACI|nr:ribosome biogenesis GTPase YlqF [Bacillus horti]MDQ0167362.1 ribosome biogenesis GTPase A [Bacillus horti]